MIKRCRQEPIPCPPRARFADFSGGTVYLADATFSGSEVNFGSAKFSNGTIDFSLVRDWSVPPKYLPTGTPPQA